MAGFKFVSVIIPTYHDWDRLKKCFDALIHQTFPQDSFEVIAVNNDPNNPMPEWILPKNFQIINEAKAGSYAARNSALKIAKGDIIAFTDSDCIPDRKWLRNAVNLMDNGAERIAGRVDLFYESEKLSFVEIFEKALSFDQEAYATRGLSVTANMITWRKNFEIVGFFNDSLMSGGDFEWASRARDLNIPIQYEASVIVNHPARRELSEIKKKIRRTSGGQISFKKNNSLIQIMIKLIGSFFLPPKNQLKKVWGRANLSVYEKIVASLIVYYLNIYTNLYKLGLKLKVNKVERA